MENFLREKSLVTPYIFLNVVKGELIIEGRAIPEDPGSFFDPLFGVLNEYFRKPHDVTLVDLRLEYINSGSSKCLLELFRILKRNYDKGNNIIVNWHYEEDDESVMELGEHYKSSFDIPFNLIEFI